LLGKLSDHEIARRLGVARTTVSKLRRRLGIAPVRKAKPRGRPWLRGVRAVLGKLSDREVARRTGVHFKTVSEVRRALSIPPAPRRATTVADRTWVPDIRHLLGQIPDREVGKRAGRSAAVVGIVRRELGIARRQRQPTVRGRGKVALTGALLRSRLSANEIARMTGISMRTVYRRRQTIPKRS
jgi:transcriptional regulator with XRE-family HTH domain